MLIALPADPLFYVLHVDGVGEYAMRRQDGARCLFVFTSKKTVSDFVELMELPEHKDFSAIELDLPGIIGLLNNILPHTAWIALDPPANCEFSPMKIDDFISILRLHGR